MITILKPEKYIAGLYERLSNEDIEVGNVEGITNDRKDMESGSINTQKLFLQNFCKENHIPIYDNYTDDGFSGANFDRPNFKRMIKDIENKKINLVIVKDLSRFGRLSSKVSYYLEEYFAEKGVRFIAVVDNIDTGGVETAEELLQFKSFFNEWFLRDVSKKIRNGKTARAKAGKVMTIYPTYGYKKDPLDKNHYVVDEEIAPIIKRIFLLARNGSTPTQIARIMTEESIPVPAQTVGNVHTRTSNAVMRGWNRNTVKKILQNVTYLGWVSNGNTKKINYKSKKMITVAKEDRIIVKDMHTPIIDEETFNIVQEMIKSRTAVRIKSYDWLLKGLLCCKECGKKLSLNVQNKGENKKSQYYIRCNTYALNSSLGLCTPHINNLNKLTEAVIEKIKTRCKEFLEVEKYRQLANETKDKLLSDKYNVKNEIAILYKKIRAMNQRIDKLFEDKYNGLLKEEDFVRIYDKQVKLRMETEKRLKQLEEMAKNEEKEYDITKSVEDFSKMKEITRTMLVSLVDKIEVSQDKEITIYYKFNILNEENV